MNLSQMHLALAFFAGFPWAPKPCELEKLIPRVSASAKELRDALSSAVAWEDYEQEVLYAEDRSAPVGLKLTDSEVSARRRLGSDILLVQVTGGAYGFRDVATVDGQEVAERGERIRRLFLDQPDQRDELRGLIEEGARFNIGDIERNLNLPTLVLPLLLADEPHGIERLGFRVPSEQAEGDGTCAISFREERSPYLVGSRDGHELPLRGTLYVTPGSGSLRRVSIQAGRPAKEHIELTVEFEAFAGWDEPLPSRMTEIYAQRLSPWLTRGEARYSNYRRFTVKSSEEWKIPK